MQILRNRIENSCYTDYEKSTARARCQQFKLMIEIVYLTRSFVRVCVDLCAIIARCNFKAVASNLHLR